jgi:hypothetical protein
MQPFITSNQNNMTWIRRAKSDHQTVKLLPDRFALLPETKMMAYVASIISSQYFKRARLSVSIQLVQIPRGFFDGKRGPTRACSGFHR